MEKITTNIGRDALIVLAVVSGRSLSATSPETQEDVTRKALNTRLR